MKLAYFDCFCGAAGDMIVGALLDAGADLDALRAAIDRLGLGECSIRAEKVRRGALAATRFHVDVGRADQPPRHLADILELIDAADLPAAATDTAKAVFGRLGEAEAKVHGIDLERVHFHEVGAVDSIVDVVAAAVAIELLGIGRVFCSALPVGSGTVQTSHGVLPIPAPATAELLAGAAIAQAPPGAVGELTTPTGAAVLTGLAESFGPPPAMVLGAVGYGAGSRDTADVPNVLRVLIGSPAQAPDVDTVVELSANLDDCSGELVGAAIEKLLAAGCLDAWAQPIYMKKSRPAWMLSALCSPEAVAAAEEIIFAETTTFGVRRRRALRSRLRRRHVTVETPYGPVRVKVGARAGADRTASPEFADCLAAAEAHNVPVKEVAAAAVEAHRRQVRR